MTTQLPFGLAARNPLWPEARWNLTGLFGHDLLILQVYSVLHDRFRCHLDIDTIHGSPGVPWNCGRMSTIPVPPPDAMRAIVESYNDVGIGVYFTFSNHLLQPDDLADRDANMLLEVIDNGSGLNGVIMASDLLYDHVRTRHPGLMLTASIIKVTEELGRDNLDYYLSACDRFESVMLHPDDVRNLPLLEKLERDKIEIMVNENCARNCPNRIKDYEVMASMLRKGTEVDPDSNDYAIMEKRHCRMPLRKLTSGIQSCNLTMTEVATVYELGYRRFKLQGRQDPPKTFLYDMLRFAVEPDLLAPVLYKAFLSGKMRRVAAASVANVRQAYLDTNTTEEALAVTWGDRPAVPDVPPEPTALVPSPVVASGLPTGDAGLHPFWPHARWSLGGLASQGRLVLEAKALLAERFDCQLDVDGIFGRLAVRWNGLPASEPARVNLDALRDRMVLLNGQGMGLQCEFAGTELTDEDIACETCNEILGILDNGTSLNRVIVASQRLADHVRSTRPGLRLSAGVDWPIEPGCDVVEHYAQLAANLDSVILPSEQVFNMDLISQLAPEKIEITVNDDSAQSGAESPIDTISVDSRSCNLTTAEMRRLYDMGYRRFRLDNRIARPDVFLYDVLRYTLEPGMLLPVVLKSFFNEWAPEMAAAILDEQ